MGIPRRVSRQAAALKPSHGASCNGCGACCAATVCSLGEHVLGLPEVAPGPCPALGGFPGAASCGLVAEPGRWAPVLTALHGPAAMSESAKLLIGSGEGCDSRINGEARDRAFDIRLARLDFANVDAMQLARRRWGLPVPELMPVSMWLGAHAWTGFALTYAGRASGNLIMVLDGLAHLDDCRMALELTS
jgi:hypothetical protein